MFRVNGKVEGALLFDPGDAKRQWSSFGLGPRWAFFNCGGRWLSWVV
jgi:hypothetical protein